MKRNMEICSRIKALRESKGMSKSELGRRSGVTTTAVWNWEENGIVPRFEAFALVAEALGVSVDYLRSGTDATVQTSSAASRTVAAIIEDARSEIASITGVALSNVRLNVEFLSH